LRIADYIRTHPNEIEANWEAFAKTISTFAPEISVWALRDHLREILSAMADNMETSQSPTEQSEKSKGNEVRGDALDRISALHARMRLNSGFNLEQAISEYRALRSSILHLWMRSQPADDEMALSEVNRFNETIDQAIAEIVTRYADRSERYSDVFLGILTHEVRNPLNVIKLSARLLSAGSLEVSQRGSVAKIARGVSSIERQMNDLYVLVQSRMRGPLPLVKTDSDLGEICERALDEVRVSRSDTIFELTKIGDLRGNWDPERLGQVIFNLAVNAVIHASAKLVQITALGDNADVVLRVSNQGAPIPPAMQDAIFDPFVRMNAPSTELGKRGLGLGLFIVKEIVSGHQGVVEVASTEAEGTTFTVRLPRFPIQAG
jgi:signal transduction histidine kinase